MRFPRLLLFLPSIKYSVVILAQKWMFETEDRGIVLEDDDVVSDSFFYFCEELLEKYKDDERINMICGMNHLGHYDKSGTSYIFTKTGAITGWASWKRVIDTWDPNYSFVDDEYQKYCLKNLLGNVLRWIATDILVLIECVYLTLPIYLRNNIATCLNSWHIRFATCPILIEIELCWLDFFYALEYFFQYFVAAEENQQNWNFKFSFH